MNCDRIRPLLSPLADGELDLERTMEMEAHLGTCAACAAAFERIKGIRTAVASPALYHRAPAALAERVRTTIGAPAEARAPRRVGLWRPLAIAAMLAIVCGAAAIAGILWQRNAEAHSRLLADLVTAHVRSVQGGTEHLMDARSSDQHTVKPWFIGKIDFAPDVPELSAHGFALAGGRLDYVDGRPVAAIVYYSGQHVINLFIWPSAGSRKGAGESLATQGFHVRHWNYDGMECWAVTDASIGTLEKFEKAYRAP